MEKVRLISLKASGRLFKVIGAERTSKKAKVALKEFLEKKGKEIAELAARNAMHFGRKEVKDIDVEEAIKELGKKS